MSILRNDIKPIIGSSLTLMPHVLFHPFSSSFFQMKRHLVCRYKDMDVVFSFPFRKYLYLENLTFLTDKLSNSFGKTVLQHLVAKFSGPNKIVFNSMTTFACIPRKAVYTNRSFKATRRSFPTIVHTRTSCLIEKRQDFKVSIQ